MGRDRKRNGWWEREMETKEKKTVEFKKKVCVSRVM